MKNWILPLIVAALAAVFAWHATLALTTRVLMAGAIHRISSRGGAGMNAMSYARLATPENQPIVRPSPDLAYSSCPFDLSDGPLLITYVPVPGRYSSLSVFDARTDAVFVRNDAQTGGLPLKLVVAQAGQKVPRGVETVRVSYAKGIALVRLLLADPSEIAKLDAVRRQSSCATIRG